MNRPTALTCLASVAVICGLAWSQPTAAQDDDAALRREIADLRSQVEELVAAQEQVDQLVAYVHAQAAAGKTLATVLADSEEKGFTFGINPESRVVLLQGLNHLASTMQQNLPADEEPEPATGRAARRQR